MEELLEGVVAMLGVTWLINGLVGVGLIISLCHISDVLYKLFKTYKKFNKDNYDS